MSKKEYKELEIELVNQLNINTFLANENDNLKEQIKGKDNYYNTSSFLIASLNGKIDILSKENVELEKDLDRLVSSNRLKEEHTRKRIKWLEKHNDDLKKIVKDKIVIIKYLEDKQLTNCPD